MQTLDIAATGMLSQQLKIDVLTNNIANASTTGFQRSQVLFKDLIYVNKARVGSPTSSAGTIDPIGIQVGTGVRVGGVERVGGDQNLVQTDQPLDLAVNGSGYFQIQEPNGTTAYTRAGNFQLDNQGNIVTSEGYLVQPGITVPPDAKSISIDRTGQVSVQIDGQEQPQILGQFQIARFINPAGLQAVGDTLFEATQASGQPIVGAPDDNGFGSLSQGYLTSSNVSPVKELTSLVKAQQNYQMMTKAIATANTVYSAIDNIRT